MYSIYPIYFIYSIHSIYLFNIIHIQLNYHSYSFIPLTILIFPLEISLSAPTTIADTLGTRVCWPQGVEEIAVVLEFASSLTRLELD